MLIMRKKIIENKVRDTEEEAVDIYGPKIKRERSRALLQEKTNTLEI